MTKEQFKITWPTENPNSFQVHTRAKIDENLVTKIRELEGVEMVHSVFNYFLVAQKAILFTREEIEKAITDLITA